MDTYVERPRDRVAFAHEAGYGRYSFLSTVAGVLVAFGFFAVAAAVIAGLSRGTLGRDLTELDWRTLSIGAAAVAVGLLFFGFLFGGYVAGRMARRAGLLNGVAVFISAVVIAGAAALAVRLANDNAADGITSNLRSIGVPTAAVEWHQIATGAAVAAFVAMLVGAVAGGWLGERWHAKLARRAMDPEVGPDAVARRKAEAELEAARVRHEAAEVRMRETHAS